MTFVIFIRIINIRSFISSADDINGSCILCALASVTTAVSHRNTVIHTFQKCFGEVRELLGGEETSNMVIASIKVIAAHRRVLAAVTAGCGSAAHVDKEACQEGGGNIIEGVYFGIAVVKG